ncbi:hypothetical protein LCI18_014786 [Fusarium solani-melongenae]|uniref:Uncharacterized protein n=1 Tax=Fusarium solani subsp. cucurbitae TaxID=2747967 RepID=A0ACD3ZSM4_FUSSC|nr:hypothetical protein LCI18_014786 [Fusarium solani-melongenae]
MTSFRNVNQSVVLNNDVAELRLWNLQPTYSNPGQYNGINADFSAIYCLPDPDPYFGFGGLIQGVTVKWSGPTNNRVLLEILSDETEGSEGNDKPGRTIVFTKGKKSDADTAS